MKLIKLNQRLQGVTNLPPVTLNVDDISCIGETPTGLHKGITFIHTKNGTSYFVDIDRDVLEREIDLMYEGKVLYDKTDLHATPNPVTERQEPDFPYAG